MARIALPAALCLLAACAEPASFDGLARADVGPGPKVVFDLLHKPLPEIPFPNDIATRRDPTSPTGLRVNASLVAPTRLEQGVRGLIDQLDGFGTFAPFTVAFDADLDYLDLQARQQDQDPGNDGVYVIDLVTGEQAALDFNGGHFPLGLARPDQYFLNDPLADVRNLLFPVTGPYANFLHPDDPARRSTPDRAADDLLTFYERSTHTLIVRPVVPLRPERKYAVILTKKIRGLDGSPIRSPFPGINHASQTEALRPVLDKLPGGVALSDIAFAWTFTTQSTTRELEAIHDGLHGSGPLAFLSGQYPATIGIIDAAGNSGYETNFTLVPLLDGDPLQPGNYRLPAAKLKEVLADPQVSGLILGGSDPLALQALLDSLQYVDYFVAGSFLAPNFLNDADRSPFDSSFHIDLQTGLAASGFARIPFFMAIPKRTAGHFPPFPVSLVGHGYKSTRFEGMIGFAGTFAKFGVASVAIDAYGHGLEGAGVDPLILVLAKAILHNHGVGALADALFTGRARDLDNDGIPDSGGDFWTADAFHTRDVIRQSVADWMQTIRIVRSFDGRGLMQMGNQVFVAGDFNGDGIPDLGGLETFQADVFTGNETAPVYPAGTANSGSDNFVFGQSLGGILCALLPAVEPTIKAAACGSTAGGLSDVVIRSTEQNVVKAALLELLGPIVATCNYDPAAHKCGSGPPTLVFDVQDVNREEIVPIAALSLSPGDRVTVVNLAQAAAGTSCADQSVPGCSTSVADAQGRLRTSIGADSPKLLTRHTPQAEGLPDHVDVTVLKAGDRLQIRVEPAAGGAARVIDNFEFANTFQGVQYPAGSELRSPARGYGYARNTPELRRLVGLSQMMLGAGDPVNYAPHWFNDPLPLRNGVPANVLVMETVGDTTVPIAAGLSLARAAGLVDINRVDPDFGVSLDQVLIRSGVTEGLAGLSRYADPTYGPRADGVVGPHIRCDAPGARCGEPILLDPSGFSCDLHGANCTDGFNAPRLNPPLREKLQVTTNFGVSALILEYLDPKGTHSFVNPQPSKPFDADLFFANMVGRYFETRGRELHYDTCQQFTATCPWIPPIPP